MKIDILTDFKEGVHQFTAGDSITVPDPVAQRFIDNGWAVRQDDPVPAPDPTAKETTLVIHSATHAQEARHG
jgi:hypothetical protein